MATHIGIDLSPVACRIIEIGVTTNVQIPETRVRSYAVVPPGGVEMSTRLASLRRRSVAVVAWGAKSDHRQVMVEQRGYEEMKAEAIGSARQAGVDSDGMLTDIAPVGASPKGATLRAVLLAMAASGDVETAVRPLREAGLRIHSVVTPADALTSLFRMRHASSVPDGIETYVAFEQTSTAIALVRNGALMASRELTWGFGGERHATSEMRPRDEIATRLADALTDFFSTVGAAPGSVRQVSICGGMPELRSMTVPLMEQLDLEVETLDSLFGIDLAHLPAPADEFRDRSAELRLAWAVAGDWRAPINLLRKHRRHLAKTAMARAAVVAGVAVGLGLGWRIQRSQWWQPTASPVSSVPASKAIARAMPPPHPTIPPAPAPAPLLSTRVAPPKSPESAKAPSVAAAATLPPPPPASRPSEPAQRASAPAPRGTEPAPRASVPAPRAGEPPQGANRPIPRTPEAPRPESARAQAVAPPVVPSVPRATEPAPRSATPPTARGAPPAPRGAPAVSPSAAPAPRVVRVRSPRREVSTPPSPAPQTPAPPQRQAVPSPPLPFDAVLGTILYSPDRKLAIIDSRIVGPGDDVRGARVVDIMPNSVLLRDAEGRMHILTLRLSTR